MFRRHQADADRAVDDLVESQTAILELENNIPNLSEKHKFYQELRGYVTDFIECFNEKVIVTKKMVFNDVTSIFLLFLKGHQHIIFRDKVVHLEERDD